MWRLWEDDAGIVALEYLLVATIVGLGMVVGLSALESALNIELTELGNAILAIDEGYYIAGGQSFGGGALPGFEQNASSNFGAAAGFSLGFKQGSWALDAPGYDFERPVATNIGFEIGGANNTSFISIP
jgi:Flp pilus assembly pilin Flp